MAGKLADKQRCPLRGAQQNVKSDGSALAAAGPRQSDDVTKAPRGPLMADDFPLALDD
jgi:hypothetical protein